MPRFILFIYFFFFKDALLEEVADYVSETPSQPNNWECVTRSQDQVYELVNHEHFNKFLESDLFYRLIVDPAFSEDLNGMIVKEPVPHAPVAPSVLDFDISASSTSPASAAMPIEDSGSQEVSRVLTDSMFISSPPPQSYLEGKSPSELEAEDREKELRSSKRDSRSDLTLEGASLETNEAHDGYRSPAEDEEAVIIQSDTVATVEAAFQYVMQNAEAQQDFATAPQEREKMDIYVYDGSQEKIVPDVVSDPA